VLKTALKGLAGHKLRLFLTALAIVAGVAFVSGTFVLTDTMRGAFDDLFGTLNEGIDATIRSEASFTSNQTEGGGRDSVPDTLLATVEAVPEVGVAQGTVVGYAQFVDKNGDAVTTGGAPSLGVNWTDNELNIATLREGRGPTGPGEVAIDASTADDNDFALGDTVPILFTGPREEFAIVGIFGFDEVDSLLGATVAAFETETAQRVMDSVGQFDSIETGAADGVSGTDLVLALDAALPAGFEAIGQADLTAEQNDDVNEGFLDVFNIILLVFAGVAVFVGAFIIANTFSIIVSQRTRELALLRAIGATGAQVTWMILLETLVVAVLASIVGIAAGVLVALGLQSLLSAFGIELPTSGLVLKPRTIVVGMAVGVVVTVVSALAPALTASRVPPVAAMRDIEHTDELTRGRLLLGGGVTFLGLVLLLLGLFSSVWNELALIGLGALVIFLGVAFLSPFFSGRMARIIGFPARRMFGMTGKLGRENAARRPVRTAATAGALMIGLALVTLFMVLGESTKVSVANTIDDAFSADFVVTPADGGFQPFSPQVTRDMEALPEIGVAAGVRQAEFRLDGSNRFMTGVDIERAVQTTNFDFVQGDLQSLAEGGMALHVDEAPKREIGFGDIVEVEFAKTGFQPVEVTAIYEAEESFVGAYVMSTAEFDQQFTSELEVFSMANAADGVGVDQARQAMASVETTYPNVDILNQAEFRQTTEDNINQLLGVITAMLLLALLIALLGITNTLALSVFERTREIGLLRAVGMTRRQVRAMIRYEAIIVSIFGAVLGITIGLLFGWLVVQATGDIGITDFAIPFGTLIIVFVLAGVAGIIAAIAPARKAARLNVLEAISYE
jgi:putative ABC transport system permease protein